MDINTHKSINRTLCGSPVLLEENKCIVRFTPTPDMAADESGLIHGGFVFGAADYAAMLAVNHPNVVLGGSDVKFLKPVKSGDTLTVQADVTSLEGRKNKVAVVAKREDDVVFEGVFTCFVLPKHILAP